MIDENLQINLLDALRSLQQLPIDFLSRLPEGFCLNEEEWDAICNAVEEETKAKFDALWTVVEPILDEDNRLSWQDLVRKCLRAGRRDLLATLPPEAEQAIAVLEAQAFLRKRKPPE